MNQLKIFPTLHKLCNGDLNKFVLLLREGIYPYEYMDTWEIFDENTISPKEAFYSELNLEGISNADYERVKKVWETFEIKKSWRVSWFVCSMRYIFACWYFENFRNKCIEKYELDPAHFLSAPELAWQAC